MLKLSGAALSAALLVSAFAASPAQAALTLQVSDSTGTSVTVHDNGTGDTNGATGVIQTDATTYGNFIFIFPTSTNSAAITAEGSPASAPGSLALSDLDIKSGTADTITIALTNTNQTSPTGSAQLLEGLTVNTLTGSGNSVTLQGFESNTNQAFNTSGLSTPTLTLTAANVTGVTATSGVGSFSSPFSVTEVATIVFGNTGGEINLNFTGTLASISAVPEPASMLLFGTVIAGVGFVTRKRFASRA